MNPAAQPKHDILDSQWRQRLSNFGFAVTATVVGGLLVAGILWGIGALSQVGDLTAKVDRIQHDMNGRFDKLETSIVALSDDTMLRKIENDINKLRDDVGDLVTSQNRWREDVELRLTNLEVPVGGSPEDDGLRSVNPDDYLPKLHRGSHR
ncbi:MAG: hypothetical protein ACR2QF_05405 [Geminicoccaceae bacterium]